VVILHESVYSSAIVACAWGAKFEMLKHLVWVMLCIFFQFKLGWIMVGLISGNSLGSMLHVADSDKAYNLYAHWSADPVEGAYCSDGKTHRAWACRQQSWGWHTTKIKHMQAYTDTSLSLWGMGLPTGGAIGVIAIFMWVCTVLKEFRQAKRSMWLLYLPDTNSKGLVRVRETGSYQLVALPLLGRLAVVGLAGARVFIAAALGIRGCQFLAHTDELSGFVLNSVALGYIFDLDELFFSVLVSEKMHLIIHNMQPVVIPHRVHGHGFNCEQIVMVTLAIAATVGVTHYYLSPFIQDVTDALESTCNASMPVLCQGGGM